MIEPAEIPQRLKAARVTSGLSRAEVAKRLDVHERTVGNWETGSAAISLEQAVNLCGIYNTTVADLTGDTSVQVVVDEMRGATMRLARVEEVLERLTERR
ncbi:COG1476 Predicted transcriptional regulators [uncultured Caudovirales phage]|uniref:COG1476 Predicted transcriptional regulators n=1 Tax=uncultured Caudovirales phage TaxID=2100421 RepID=A0A6J5RWH7_9CAUD|nr:COG1476 Predicted transcriptional regulators [uncultured Caudovirales phage]CAB4187698.1 COG1476 Predicted transcriptional regulators [uncultured Caudovirales phage]CAB4200292.1 COG1476 Predicted transcriptional regulators [uncultured Caudovirales phage]